MVLCKYITHNVILELLAALGRASLSQGPRGLKRSSVAVRLLRLEVAIQPGRGGGVDVFLFWVLCVDR